MSAVATKPERPPVASRRKPNISTAIALAEAERIHAGVTVAKLVASGRTEADAALTVAKRARIVAICKAEHIRETAFLLPVHRAFARLHTAIFASGDGFPETREAMDALAEAVGLDPITLDAIPGHLSQLN